MEGFSAATVTILVAVTGPAIATMTPVVTLFFQLRTDTRDVEGRLNAFDRDIQGRFDDLYKDIKTLNK